MYLVQGGAKKLKFLAMSLDIAPLVTALEGVLAANKAMLACNLCGKEFKYRSVLHEHIAVKHKKQDLLAQYPECFDNKQVQLTFLVCLDMILIGLIFSALFAIRRLKPEMACCSI